MQDGKLPVFVEENILQQIVSERAPFAVLMGAIYIYIYIYPLYTISLRPVYNKILRLPLTCVLFLPSRAVTMQFSQAPHTTNPSTSASTEKQQPRLQQLPYWRACGKNNSPPDRCLTLETKIHSADILLSFNNLS